ncbi:MULTISPECIES: DUF1672 family protein [Bacillaceae]|uniref:DUF1672 domain-containing protein n=1 Tax=Evansella alkalicola TaxID=745819 RepID=A0ABS6JTJ6_9BACI|nr:MULTISPECIES: DUF1672 family protein [Bacillaceae]MBU9720567.1 DUF1672 domain-containing protein [Bacillus alkalicola]
MKTKSIILAISLLVLIMIGGCEVMDEITETPEEKHAREAYVSVNDYTGEEKDLPDGQRNDPIAKEKFDEIAEATQKFFLEEYKTEVIVHNAVGAKHGIMVFVESPNEPKFHTFAMMPVDAIEEKIFPDDIWTVEMQVEQALYGGLLVMVMEEEFASLDQYFEEFKKNFPVTGLPQTAINNVKSSGYTTPYYFIQTMSMREEFDQLIEPYFDNPNISNRELKEYFDVSSYNPEDFSLVINLYMNEPNSEPDDVIFEQLLEDIKYLDVFPKGSYTVSLHDNNINKFSGMGHKDNTLIEGNIAPIIKN